MSVETTAELPRKGKTPNLFRFLKSSKATRQPETYSPVRIELRNPSSQMCLRKTKTNNKKIITPIKVLIHPGAMTISNSDH